MLSLPRRRGDAIPTYLPVSPGCPSVRQSAGQL